jgi:integrase/recombinase XerD
MTGVRFLFRVTLRRHDLAAEVWHLKEPQKLPPVLSRKEVKRILAMATLLRKFSYRIGRVPVGKVQPGGLRV